MLSNKLGSILLDSSSPHSGPLQIRPSSSSPLAVTSIKTTIGVISIRKEYHLGFSARNFVISTHLTALQPRIFLYEACIACVYVLCYFRVVNLTRGLTGMNMNLRFWLVDLRTPCVSLDVFAYWLLSINCLFIVAGKRSVSNVIIGAWPAKQILVGKKSLFCFVLFQESSFLISFKVLT